MSGVVHVVHPAPQALRCLVRDPGERFRVLSAMTVDQPGERLAAPLPLQVRRRAYEAVQAVLSDDHNYERGVEGVRAVAEAARTEHGAVGLAAILVELSLRLASALERVATDQEICAVDLAEVWFVD